MPPAIESHEICSSILNLNVRFELIQPGETSHSTAPRPVYYLLPGHGGGGKAFIRLTRLLGCLREGDPLIVIPDSGKRWFINDHEGYRYQDFLLEELIPYIDQEYHTIQDRAGRAIGGFSKGALAALNMTFRFPGKFSALVSHGGAHWAPNMPVTDPYADQRQPGFAIPTPEDHLAVWGPLGSETRQRFDPFQALAEFDPSQQLALYVDVGRSDFERILKPNLLLHEHLQQRDLEHEFHLREGGHDLHFLRLALPCGIEFLRQHF